MATDQSTKIIPGIPLGALDAIGDANVRDVLRALVSTHNVRNNLVGTGDDAFITTRQALQITRTTAPGDTATAPRMLAHFLHGGGGGPFGPGSLSEALGTIHITLDRAVQFQVTVQWVVGGISDGRTRVEIHNGSGAVLLSQSDSVQRGYARSHMGSSGFQLDPGEHALTFHAGNDGGGSYTLGAWGILVMPVA